MSGLQPSYMLLPNFSYRPDEDLELGSIIALSGDTDLPEPSYVFNDATRQPPTRIVEEREEPSDQPWSSQTSTDRSYEAGIWANIPILDILQADFGVKSSKGQSVSLECSRIDTKSFEPNDAYIATAIKDPKVSTYLDHYFRPSVFMVTGMKIVPADHVLKIDFGRESDGRLGGGAGVNATNFGVPLAIGAKLEKSQHKDSHFHTEKEGPLIVAYRLLRIRLKVLDSNKFTSKGFLKHAVLMNDDDEAIDTKTPENLNEFWDLENVTGSTDLTESE